MAAEHDRMEPRVLVADDDQSIRQLLGTIIRREDLSVDLAADGAEAIDLLKQREYPVILLDLMMPRTDGFGVIRWLKEHPPVQKPVIIVISAYADQKFKDVDADLVSGVLRKPFDIADVGNLVKLCVHGFQSALQSSMLKTGDETVRVLSTEGIARLHAMRQKIDEQGEGNGNGHGESF
ncbi:MAG TPA: response regulator [Thermoanaerobaculia bacterium]|nr:response regulator [Thermoanaerobaculia bacterium]